MLPLALWSVAALAWSMIANLVVGDLGYAPRNLLLTLGLLLLAYLVGWSRTDIGLDGAAVRRGLQQGATAAAAIGTVVLGAFLLATEVPALSGLLSDDRAALSSGGLIAAVAWKIPVGTVLFEEVLFRGVLLKAAMRRHRTTVAVGLTSAVFGLWHVAPTIVGLQANGVAPASLAGVGAIVGTVAVTTGAGVAFSWLRLRTGSLLAPMLAHWATNAFGLLAAAALSA
jgi:uncharacterized protein